MEGYLPVGDGHELYYERIGKRRATPLLFVHGGPGSGFTVGHKKLFDPERFDAIFYDQRGSGKSRPYLSLKGNTTLNLVEDIEKLRLHLGVERFVLAGASWGATLALLYAEAHPEHVAGLSLMSIFLATHAESQGFVDGSTAKAFPVIWDRYVSLVPEDNRNDAVGYYLSKMRDGGAEERERFAYQWALYDLSLSAGEASEEVIGPVVRQISYQSLALMTAYYIVHDFFLPENAILDGVEVLSGIPISIMQGIDDPITPPAAAQKLHSALSSSKLFLLNGRHAGEEMKKQFVEEAALFASA